MLRGVDLDLPAQTLVRIEGANGSGKSTLLRLLAGIDAPTGGRITGRRPRTAYVPERFPAALPFTAAGYLVHLGRIHGLPRPGPGVPVRRGGSLTGVVHIPVLPLICAAAMAAAVGTVVCRLTSLRG